MKIAKELPNVDSSLHIRELPNVTTLSDLGASALYLIATLPNLSTLRDLGSSALYLIVTLPDEEKQTQLERIENGDNPTVRELPNTTTWSHLGSRGLMYQNRSTLNDLSTLVLFSS